jgi:protein TonB
MAHLLMKGGCTEALMAQALVVTHQPSRSRLAEPVAPSGVHPFESLVDSTARPVKRGGALGLSLALHTALVTAAVVVPVLLYDAMPEPGEAVHAFFVTPSLVAPPPPPPPPPAAGVRLARATAVAPIVATAPSFVAPMDVQPLVAPSEGLDLGGVEGGVPGGVEGGMPGGVVGGVIGGLPLEAPPPRKVVRVGGAIVAPKLVHRVAPVYPELAAITRLHGVVILEATVDETGRVQTVSILRGQPVLQEAAIEAVKQWRYQPLLLNGEATPFILTVTLNFNLIQ